MSRKRTPERDREEPSTKDGELANEILIERSTDPPRLCGICLRAFELAGRWHRAGKKLASTSGNRESFGICPDCWDKAICPDCRDKNVGEKPITSPRWADTGTIAARGSLHWNTEAGGDYRKLTKFRTELDKKLTDVIGELISSAYMAIAGLGAYWPETRERVRAAIVDLQAADALLQTLPKATDAVFDENPDDDRDRADDG